MSPPEASRASLRSIFGFLLLWASVQGDHLEGTGSANSLPRVDQDVMPQNDSRIPDSLWVNEEEETNGQLLNRYKTSLISCEDIGVFPLQGSCNEFIHCEMLKGPAIVLTCPQTTVFDTEKKKCILSASSTRSECQSIYDLRDSEGRRRKRSETSPSSCSNEIIESLAQSSREACTSAHDIDTYITNVNAVRSLELRSFDKEEYKAIIRDFNNDLTLSQSNYNEWRHGQSVFSAIKETFLAAKNFEPTFNTKYEENQKRVEEITSQDTSDIKQMEEDIEALKSETKRIQVLLSTLVGSSDQGPVDYLKNSLREKEQQLQKLVSSESRIKTEREIAALIKFLETVRASVVDIQQNAIRTTSRVETFQQKIVKDSSIFLRHRETAQNGITYLQNQRKENENEKLRIAAEMSNLGNRIQHENNEISRIRNLLHGSENELRDINNRISGMEHDARERQRIGKYLFAIPVVGWIAGGVLLGTGIEDEKRLRNHRQDAVNLYRNMINVHQSQIDSKTREISNAQNRISTLTSKTRQLDEELTSFSKLDKDLAKIQNDINSILPSVNKALASVGKLKAVFDGIRQNLDDTLEVAKSRKEKAEEKNVLYFIYNGISDLKCKWNQANAKIIALDHCN